MVIKGSGKYGSWGYIGYIMSASRLEEFKFIVIESIKESSNSRQEGFERDVPQSIHISLLSSFPAISLCPFWLDMSCGCQFFQALLHHYVSKKFRRSLSNSMYKIPFVSTFLMNCSFLTHGSLSILYVCIFVIKM